MGRKPVLHIPLFILFALALTGLNKKDGFSQGFDAELISTTTDIGIRNGKMTTTHSFDLLINNRSADYLSEIEVPYSGIEKLISLEASLHSSEGALIRKLSKKDVTEQHDIGSFSMYEDQFIRKFTLRNSSYPYRVKWSYTTETSEFLTICRWIPVFRSDMPTRKARLRITSPVDYAVNAVTSGIESSDIHITDKEQVREWECSFLNVYDAEVNQEDDYEHMPCVWAVPENFHFDRGGNSRSWNEFGQWVYDLNAQPDGLPEKERTKVASVKSEFGSVKDQIRELFYYAQDRTRYINVTLETGGMKPFPASYVSNNGYGDCKALSVYLMALLHEAGIACHYTLVNAGTVERDINPAFIANQFNHAIVMVPLEGDSLWLDCTSENPFGYTGSFIHDRYALIISAKGGSLARIPPLSMDQVCTYRQGVIRITASHQAEIRMKVKVSGREAESVRIMNKNTGSRDRFREFSELIRLPSFSADSIRFLAGNRDDFYCELDYSGKSTSLVRQHDNELMIPLIPLDMIYLESPGERTTTMKLPLPVCVTDTIQIVIPTGYHINGIPEHRSDSCQAGIYSVCFSGSSDNLTVIRQLRIGAGLYSGDEYASLYSFLRRIRKIEAYGTVSLIKS